MKTNSFRVATSTDNVSPVPFFPVLWKPSVQADDGFSLPSKTIGKGWSPSSKDEGEHDGRTETYRRVTRFTSFDELATYVSPRECGDFLGLGRTATYDLIRRGEIPSLVIGRRRFIPKTALLLKRETRR